VKAISASRGKQFRIDVSKEDRFRREVGRQYDPADLKKLFAAT
jgi:hypothetical protein